MEVINQASMSRTLYLFVPNQIKLSALDKCNEIIACAFILSIWTLNLAMSAAFYHTPHSVLKQTGRQKQNKQHCLRACVGSAKRSLKTK